MVSFRTNSEAETVAFGERMAGLIEPRAGLQIGLSGPLGSGKTRLVKGLLYGFGLGRDVTVQSPTYVFYRRYPGRAVPLFHFDFYRLSGAEDLEEIDLSEALQEGIVVMEWADRVKGKMPPLDYDIRLSYGEKTDERLIEVLGPEAFLKRL